MSRFVGNTFVEVEEVRGKLRELPVYSLCGNDIEEDPHQRTEDFVLKDDYDGRINDIEDEIKKIIKTLENYELADGIDELKILLEKLY